MTRSLQLALPFLIALLLHGCARNAQDRMEVADSIERGPLKLTVRAAPSDITVGDSFVVTVELLTPEGYAVEFPTAEAFGEIPTRTLDATGPLPAESGAAWRTSYELTPLVSGELELPPLAVAYRPPSDAGTQPAFKQELVSSPLKLQVASVLTANDAPTAPRDISAPLLPPAPPTPLWQKLTIVAAATTCVALAFLVYRAWRRYASRPPPPIAPEVWALQALATLEDPTWLDASRLREFTYRVTEILRAYIERKFGLAAPEMTTEEFLTVLARRRHSLPYDADRLRAFLESCDFIKYAALQPRREDAASMLATARAFVHATAAAAEAARTPATPEGQAA